MKVGDIRVTEPNIHAGTKYMDQLMSRYFPDASFSEGNRPLFAFHYCSRTGEISFRFFEMTSLLAHKAAQLGDARSSRITPRRNTGQIILKRCNSAFEF